MDGLREIGFAVGRIVLGMVVLIGGLVTLDLIVYISAIGSTFSERIAAAYDRGYDGNYAQTYDVAYQEAYGKIYGKGYDKGYEIGLGIDSEEGTATLVELHNPTYRELREFLARDSTDSNLYIKGEYVSFDFSAELNNNAEASGIRAAFVRIFSKEWGHGMVAFETVDRGLVFIEPQSDKKVEMVIGEPFPWWSAGATRTPDYDDVIVEIQIIW